LISLVEALGIKDGDVVALVGAGGKTTIMFATARELAGLGKKVVVTTTTRIMTPGLLESPSLIVVDNREKALRLLSRELQVHSIVATGTRILDDGKLVGIPPEWVEDIEMLKGVSNVLVEADGSAGKPLKAPREYEPVIPLNSDIVVSVVGIDALGKELSEKNVHRVDRVSALTSLKPGERITTEAMVLVMTHPLGNAKGSPEGARIIQLINKVDDNKRLSGARDIARLLVKRGVKRVVLTHAAFKPEVVEVIYG